MGRLLFLEGQLLAELCGEAQQAAVGVGSGDELQAGLGRWQDDGRVSAEAGGGSEAEEASACVGVAGAGEEAREGGDGREQKVEFAEELFVL